MKNYKIENKLVFYSGLIYLIIMTLFVTLKIFAYFGVFDFSGANYLYKIVVQVGLMFVLPLCLYAAIFKKSPKQTFKFFGYKAVSKKTIALSFVIGIFLFILVTYFSNFWSTILSLIGFKFGTGVKEYSVLEFVLDILLVGILPAVCEETAHRGLVLNGMKKNGAIRAILITGLLFGLMHFNIVQFGYASLVGMLLCLVTLLSHSIIPAIIIHFTNNFLSVLITYSMNSDFMRSGALDWITNFEGSSNTVMLFIFKIMLALIAFYVIFLCITKILAEGKKQEYQKFKKNLAEEVKKNNLENDIDITNEQQVLTLYRQISMMNLEQKLMENKITINDIVKGNTKNATELILSENMSLPKKAHKPDYIFHYIAIFLGSVGTILSLVLGLI